MFSLLFTCVRGEKMSEIQELADFLTETRLDVKAVALQQTLGGVWQ